MIPFFYSFYGGTKKAKRLGVLILQSIQKHKRGLSIFLVPFFHSMLKSIGEKIILMSLELNLISFPKETCDLYNKVHHLLGPWWWSSGEQNW